MGTGKLNAGSNPAMDWHPIQSFHARETAISSGLMGHLALTLPYLTNNNNNSLSFTLVYPPSLQILHGRISLRNREGENHCDIIKALLTWLSICDNNLHFLSILV